MSSHLSSIALAFAMAAIGGCSLALAPLEVPLCEVDADCDRLADVFPERVTTCVRFQCDEELNRCFLGPLDRDGDTHLPIEECGGDDCDDEEPTAYAGNEETCDGVDNDCNDLIDDSTEIGWSEATIRTGVGAIDTLSWSTESTGAIALSTADGVGTLDRIDASASSVTGNLVLAARQNPDEDLATLDGRGCPSTTGIGAPTTCRPVQVAVAAGTPMGWAAFVHRDGCDDGLLRVGLLDTPGSRVELMGTNVRSNTWRGVDRGTPTGTCTRTATGTGATAPSIVTATDATSAPETAVLAWIRDRASRTCASPPAEVAALGLWRATGQVGGMTGTDWVVATDAGVPEVIGTTAGAAPPALAATGTGEVIVAFGDAEGGVRVMVIEALATVGAAPAPDATPPLTLGESTLVGSGAADRVALVVTPGEAGTTRIGLAWTTGCDAGGVRFAALDWRRSERTLVPGSVVELAASGASVPTIAYVGHGFVRPTAMRGGALVGDDDGGWLVSWRDESLEPASIVARRVLAVDHSLVDVGAIPVVPEASADPRWPFVYPAGREGELALGFYSADIGALVGVRLLDCQ